MTLKFRSDASGGALLNESGVEVLKVDAVGNVTFPSGLIKQSKVKRSFFSAIMGSNFGTLPVDAWVPLNNLWTEILDSANAFTPTNGRFMPQVAGWYQINCGVTISGSAGILGVIEIWKNGATHRRVSSIVMNSSSVIGTSGGSGCAVYFNGTTDYIDLRVFTNMTGASVLGDAAGQYTWMNGYLIEAD